MGEYSEDCTLFILLVGLDLEGVGSHSRRALELFLFWFLLGVPTLHEELLEGVGGVRDLDQEEEERVALVQCCPLPEPYPQHIIRVDRHQHQGELVTGP